MIFGGKIRKSITIFKKRVFLVYVENVCFVFCLYRSGTIFRKKTPLSLIFIFSRWKNSPCHQSAYNINFNDGFVQNYRIKTSYSWLYFSSRFVTFVLNQQQQGLPLWILANSMLKRMLIISWFKRILFRPNQ